VIRDVIVGAIVAVVVNELTDVSSWLAVRITRWAAKRIYPVSPERAARRSEDWEALISESIPTKISKLCFGLGIGCAGLWCSVIGHVPAVLAAVRRALTWCFYGVGKGLHWILIIMIVLGPEDNTTVIQWLEGIGGAAALLAGWYLVAIWCATVRYGAERWLLRQARARTEYTTLRDAWLHVVASGVPEELE
jgi:hypothetical protein